MTSLLDNTETKESFQLWSKDNSDVMSFLSRKNPLLLLWLQLSSPQAVGLKHLFLTLLILANSVTCCRDICRAEKWCQFPQWTFLMVQMKCYSYGMLWTSLHRSFPLFICMFAQKLSEQQKRDLILPHCMRCWWCLWRVLHVELRQDSMSATHNC